MRKLYVILFFANVAINIFIPGSAEALNLKTSQGVEYPSDENFVSDKEHARIKVDCNEVNEKDGRIECTFKQVMVRHRDVKGSLEALRLYQLKKASDEDIRKEYGKICKSLDMDHGLKKRIAAKYKNAATDEERMHITHINNVCKNPSRANVVKLIEDDVEKEKMTCTIFDTSYVLLFQYNANTKQWLHQAGTRNNCGVINIDYFQKNARKGLDSSWNYVFRGMVTNKAGKMLGESCSNWANSLEKETIYYSNNIDSLLTMNCKYIQF